MSSSRLGVDSKNDRVSNGHMEPTTCQHCGESVAFTRRPADAGYAAFAHTATNTVACQTTEVAR